MRLFVAAYPPVEACAHLAAAVDELAVGKAAAEGVNARLATRDNWHMTLCFIGEVPDTDVPAAEAAIERALQAWRGDGRPRLRFAGGGRFGRGRFTVLWVGLRGDVPAVAGLGSTLRRQLKRAKLPYDPRPFRPHLTLARPGDRVDVAGDLVALDAYEGPEWTLDEVRLMRSHLGPKPTYDRMASWPVNGAGSG